MADNSVRSAGEIRLWGGHTFPDGWLPCDGRSLLCDEYPALHAVILETYGSDHPGHDFKLPDLRGRVPMGMGGGYVLGIAAGTEGVVLEQAQMPQHAHEVQALSNKADTNAPQGALLANAAQRAVYADAANLVSMNAGALTNAGANRAHSNQQPYLVLNFIISVEGVRLAPAAE